MIKLLCPGYEPPNRKTLSEKLLDQISDKIDAMMTKELSEDACSRPITLLQDGWLSARNDPIIATTLHTGKGSPRPPVGTGLRS